MEVVRVQPYLHYVNFIGDKLAAHKCQDTWTLFTELFGGAALGYVTQVVVLRITTLWVVNTSEMELWMIHKRIIAIVQATTILKTSKWGAYRNYLRMRYVRVLPLRRITIPPFPQRLRGEY